MKVGFAQLNPRVGDISNNLEKIKECVSKARAQKARLIIFPELAITGYPPRDLLEYSFFIEENLLALRTLATWSIDIAIVCGHIDINRSETGKPLFNCATFMDAGGVRGTYKKQLLPYYDVFEEERFFEPGNEPGIFSLDGKRIGVTICEDMWNTGDYLKRRYSHDPVSDFTSTGLDLLINLSASPFHLGKPEMRIALAKEVVTRVKAPLILCNQMGGNDELLFDGSSFAMLKNGLVSKSIPSFETGISYFELDGDLTEPLHQPRSTYEWIAKALTLGIRDYVKKTGMQKVCLGLSGGIDSAVVACLAVLALGKNQVLALSMPSRFSSLEGQKDAALIASNLGIDFRILSIDSAYQHIRGLFAQDLKSVTLENLQPRLRMILLMAFCNETGALLLNTSNKSEISTGFATQYGDSAGALSVIGDLTKGEVYALAEHLNMIQNVIPRSVFDRIPTAELKEGQKDEDALPPYSDLDLLVHECIVGFETSEEAFKLKIPNTSVEIFKRLHLMSEYKRRQFPPILRLTEKAFGMGRRMPIAAKLPL